MMIAPVEQGDLDRRAGKPKGRLQSAEAGADDHHAMGFCRARLVCGHCKRPLAFRVLRTLDDVGVCRGRSKAGQALRGISASPTRRREGSHNPATAPSNESPAATPIAAAKPVLKCAGELAAPFAENTAT